MVQADGHLDTRSPQHFDKGVDAEHLDSPTNEVTHPRLGDTEEPGCSRLCKAACLDQLFDRHHEVCAHSQVLRLARWETDVEENIA